MSLAAETLQRSKLSVTFQPSLRLPGKQTVGPGDDVKRTKYAGEAVNFTELTMEPRVQRCGSLLVSFPPRLSSGRRRRAAPLNEGRTRRGGVAEESGCRLKAKRGGHKRKRRLNPTAGPIKDASPGGYAKQE